MESECNGLGFVSAEKHDRLNVRTGEYITRTRASGDDVSTCSQSCAKIVGTVL